MDCKYKVEIETLISVIMFTKIRVYNPLKSKQRRIIKKQHSYSLKKKVRRITNTEIVRGMMTKYNMVLLCT